MARASALHAEGHRFDSDILHKINYGLKISNYEFKTVLLKFKVTQVISITGVGGSNPHYLQKLFSFPTFGGLRGL